MGTCRPPCFMERVGNSTTCLSEDQPLLPAGSVNLCERHTQHMSQSCQVCSIATPHSPKCHTRERQDPAAGHSYKLCRSDRQTVKSTGLHQGRRTMRQGGRGQSKEQQSVFVAPCAAVCLLQPAAGCTQGCQHLHSRPLPSLQRRLHAGVDRRVRRFTCTHAARRSAAVVVSPGALACLLGPPHATTAAVPNIAAALTGHSLWSLLPAL